MVSPGGPDLGILSWSASYYSTRRLLEAARAAGLQAVLLDPGRLVLRLEPSVSPLWDDGAAVPLPRMVIPRVGSVGTTWSLALLRALVAAGVESLVPAAGIAGARDKVQATQRLLAAEIPVVPTTVVREPWHADDAIAAAGGPPVVLKPPDGTQGRGVVLARDMAGARSTLEALTHGGKTSLVQPLRTVTGRARDLRVVVIGGVATAACWRVAAEDEFRSNVHRGAAVVPADLAADETQGAARLSEAAARALDLPICGVDLLPASGSRRWEVLEVNASPGLEGIERATGLDLARVIVDSARRLGGDRHVAQ